MTEAEWAAGFFDGEGCTIYVKSTADTIRMVVAQVDPNGVPEVLVRFKAAVGEVGRIAGPMRTNKNTTCYRYECDGIARVVPVIEILWPHLSGPKQRQIRAAFQKYYSRERWSAPPEFLSL